MNQLKNLLLISKKAVKRRIREKMGWRENKQQDDILKSDCDKESH